MIGEYIQKLRQHKRLSLTELANRAGVAKSYLSSIERNMQTNPSIEFLKKIAPVLDADIHSLIGQVAGYPSFVLDKEWIQLAREVEDAGISVEVVRNYLKQLPPHVRQPNPGTQ
ncbi:helix-turn-helix domain-containing protein [Paenibacillus xerothermodurans]|uniref:helix-turn-helix domain-containing protein n=1 Tax=Paenibacillus xerothermodurans TaxID=1977292 RepID=UPI000B7868DC|nr:helix-turn-helix domain-containing protein [Paenibacillus xerothermodurans]